MLATPPERSQHKERDLFSTAMFSFTKLLSVSSTAGAMTQQMSDIEPVPDHQRWPHFTYLWVKKKWYVENSLLENNRPMAVDLI